MEYRNKLEYSMNEWKQKIAGEFELDQSDIKGVINDGCRGAKLMYRGLIAVEFDSEGRCTRVNSDAIREARNAAGPIPA